MLAVLCFQVALADEELDFGLATNNLERIELIGNTTFSDNVSVLLNNGDGTYAAAVNYAAGDGPRSVFAGDLDGDSDLDLAVANAYSDNVTVHLNNGDGTFSDTTVMNPLYSPGSSDITNGFVELCLEASPINPCTTIATDCMTLSIGESGVIIVTLSDSGQIIILPNNYILEIQLPMPFNLGDQT